MKIFALHILHKELEPYSNPVLYSTEIEKLRKVMLNVTGQHTCYVGSTDVTNERNMNSYTDQAKLPSAKICQVPTLI